MPNLIHSLDATSIALLYDSFGNDSRPIYTVHDCFAVTADNILCLIEQLKSVYLKMYSEQAYLLEVHRYIISVIKKTFGSHIFIENDKYIIIAGSDKKGCEKILYPSIESVLNPKGNIDSLKLSKNIVT
jgi:DNA-directed RNA polymerase